MSTHHPTDPSVTGRQVLERVAEKVLANAGMANAATLAKCISQDLHAGFPSVVPIQNGEITRLLNTVQSQHDEITKLLAAVQGQQQEITDLVTALRDATNRPSED